MTYANFLIGKSGLSIAGFLTYTGYELIGKGVEIINKVQLTKSPKIKGNLLVLLAGNGNLETKLKESIELGKKRCSKDVKYNYNSNKYPALSPELDFYKNIKTYDNLEESIYEFQKLSERYLKKVAQIAIQDARKAAEKAKNKKEK